MTIFQHSAQTGAVRPVQALRLIRAITDGPGRRWAGWCRLRGAVVGHRIGRMFRCATGEGWRLCSRICLCRARLGWSRLLGGGTAHFWEFYLGWLSPAEGHRFFCGIGRRLLELYLYVTSLCNRIPRVLVRSSFIIGSYMVASHSEGQRASIIPYGLGFEARGESRQRNYNVRIAHLKGKVHHYNAKSALGLTCASFFPPFFLEVLAVQPNWKDGQGACRSLPLCKPDILSPNEITCLNRLALYSGETPHQRDSISIHASCLD